MVEKQGVEKVNIASGICQVCDKPIHLTKHYGWLHDSKDTVNHKAVLNFETEDGKVIVPREKLGIIHNGMSHLMEDIIERINR